MTRQPLFGQRALSGLLAVSVLTNAVVLARTAPIDWHRLVHRDQPVPPVVDGEHMRGDAAAPITIIEYADFQCPFCARYHETLKAAVDEDRTVRWVYRHLPLPSIHPMAVAAAEAAECASDQGRFWEYADLLYARRSLDAGALAAIAEQLGLDDGRFGRCFESGRHRSRVAADAEAFAEGHLEGTPVSFVDGVRLDGAVSLDDLRRAIAAARQRAAINNQ